MIGLLIEIFATMIDVVFMVWFTVKFQGYHLRDKPYAWLWGIGLFLFQLFIDFFYHGFDLLPVFGAFLIVFGCAFSGKAKPIQPQRQALL